MPGTVRELKEDIEEVGCTLGGELGAEGACLAMASGTGGSDSFGSIAKLTGK